ncbi:unnamed protein product [Darwinula stevensoni]|uniref:NAD kinase 2, mitochondrial n=1 Tax=Darwinula stevensoni TaxID=69355 RepID=A0A7R8ZYH3_9CRUS|nr:unnamed protein product [Darwinula stevensoni]CAG0880502.1 unnamed protein product [Darwinula stevensoni]
MNLTWHVVSKCGLHSSVEASMKPSAFKPKKALVITKVTRYEFEKRRFQDVSDEELRELLSRRGSDLDMLKQRHLVHKECEKRVVQALESHGIETKVAYRFDYTIASVKWADVIVSAGGDGTFLLAASKVHDSNKLVVGFNSDPSRSEGHLCLPKKYSLAVDEAVKKLCNGQFRWMFRNRIRITIAGENVFDQPVELHDQQLLAPEYRFLEDLPEQLQCAKAREMREGRDSPTHHRVLPVLALNEVFIGESLSARVSYCEISLDNGDKFKQKCSGFIFSTGTGSTSWTFNINKLTHQNVEKLLHIIEDEVPSVRLNKNDCRLIEKITARFNNELIVDPSEPQMVYTIRDPITMGVLPTPLDRKPRGFARSVDVKSRCVDASLVVDGSLSFRFNDGTSATLEVLDSDALRTIILHED